MNTIEKQESEIQNFGGSGAETFVPKRARSRRPSAFRESANIGKSKRQPRLLLSMREAAERLGCHWQTILLREKKGYITGIKIGGRKYFHLVEIEQMRRDYPVARRGPGGGPGSGIPIGPQYILEPRRPSLWERIKSLFV